MPKVIFAAPYIAELPAEVIGGDDLTYVDWQSWEHKERLRPIGCWRMRIPYRRIAADLRKMDEIERVFVYVDPRRYLQRMLSEWYRLGGSAKSFVFYRNFREMVDENGLETEMAVRLFAERLDDRQLRPLFNPQCAVIDPARRPDNIRRALRKFDRIVRIEELPDNENETPFDTLDFERYEALFSHWITGDLELFRALEMSTREKAESGMRNKKKHTPKSREKKQKQKNKSGEEVRTLISSMNRKKLRGRVTLDRLPAKPLRIRLECDGKLCARTGLKAADFEKKADGTYRASFELDLKGITPPRELRLLLMPGRHEIRLGKRARAFLKEWLAKEGASSSAEERP